jgi:hypothetical protein
VGLVGRGQETIRFEPMENATSLDCAPLAFNFGSKSGAETRGML